MVAPQTRSSPPKAGRRQTRVAQVPSPHTSAHRWSARYAHPPRMPATLPALTPSLIPDTLSDYNSSGLPDPVGHQDASQIKRCCQCHSPLADSQMSFHVELAPTGPRADGTPRQEQICTRCIIRGGLLNISEEESGSSGTDEPALLDDAMLCTGAPLQYLAIGPTDLDHDGIPYASLSSPTQSFTPPLTPDGHATPDRMVVDVDGDSRQRYHHDDEESNISMSLMHSTPPSAWVSTSLPASLPDYYPPASPPGGASHHRSSPPPNTSSPHASLHEAKASVRHDEYQNEGAAKKTQIVLPDLYKDITHLRRRSDGRGCLYPGSVFSGTQRSGRSSYDVTVTIVDVSFAEATLTGYLLIHNLTSSHPRLTTLFTADLIGGPAHGFHTGAWGATEEDDMTHWSRFRGFSALKKEMRGPRGTVSSNERNCVFMRWKERFLVPDHRIRDINGASFAGFYYVCVDLDPSSPAESSSSPAPAVSPSSAVYRSNSPRLPPTPRNRARAATLAETSRTFDWDNHKRERVEALEKGTGKGYGTAMMEGLYFHQNSEPYQHLSLRHMPERTSSVFEFH